MSLSKNDAEQVTQIVMTPGTTSTSSESTSSLKIDGQKIYDTSSSKDFFNDAGYDIGSVIKVSGFGNQYRENNRIFEVVDKESGGEYIQVDKEIKDVSEADMPSVSFERNPNNTDISSLVQEDITINDVVTDAVNFRSASSSPAVVDETQLAITDTNQISSFAATDVDDQLLVTIADLSKG